MIKVASEVISSSLPDLWMLLVNFSLVCVGVILKEV